MGIHARDGAGPRTQVPAIVHGQSAVLGVLPSGLDSKPANRLLSAPWLGGTATKCWLLSDSWLFLVTS